MLPGSAVEPVAEQTFAMIKPHAVASGSVRCASDYCRPRRNSPMGFDLIMRTWQVPGILALIGPPPPT